MENNKKKKLQPILKKTIQKIKYRYLLRNTIIYTYCKGGRSITDVFRERKKKSDMKFDSAPTFILYPI